MVATDAIGMGLNMDLDHVAFAAPHEVRRARAAQADRGRDRADRRPRRPPHERRHVRHHRRDAGRSTPRSSRRSRTHRFDPLTPLHLAQHANSTSVSANALLRSLERRTPQPGPDPRARSRRSSGAGGALRAIPRSRRSRKGRDAHRAALGSLPDSGFPQDPRPTRTRACWARSSGISPRGADDACRRTWVDEQIERIDRVDGDIDMLTQRLAHIRTWTYVANRVDWLADAARLAGTHARRRGPACRMRCTRR